MKYTYNKIDVQCDQ